MSVGHSIHTLKERCFFSKIKNIYYHKLHKNRQPLQKWFLIEKYLNPCDICRNTSLLLYLQLKLQRNCVSHQNSRYLPQLSLEKSSYIVFFEQNEAFTPEAVFQAWWALYVCPAQGPAVVTAGRLRGGPGRPCRHPSLQRPRSVCS